MNYRGHTATNTLFLIVLFTGAFLFFKLNEFEICALLVGYVIGTLYLSPDLDIHSQPFKNWGKIKLIWLPYQKLVRHRSKLSHSPIIGTSFRLSYLLLVVLLFLKGLNFVADSLSHNYEIHFLYDLMDRLILYYQNFNDFTVLLFFIIGVELSSIAHIIADKLSDWAKNQL